MSADLAAFQALLRRMREQFLDELPERCDAFDNLILALERPADDQAAFDELFRGVHSLKGSGGTHGLPILTTICHQLENLLTESAARDGFGEAFVARALAYVDLLRRVEAPARTESPDFAAIEADLEALRANALQSRKAGLVAESSAAMACFYEKALGDLPVQLTMVDNGLVALERLVREPFDFAVVGRELHEINGIALMAALRASQSPNRDIPAVLVTSNREGVPPALGFAAVLPRDRQLADALVAAVRPLLQAVKP